MPNQRKEGLESLSAWIDVDLKKNLKLLSDQSGVSMSAMIISILEEEIEKRKEKNGNDRIEGSKGTKR